MKNDPSLAWIALLLGLVPGCASVTIADPDPEPAPTDPAPTEPDPEPAPAAFCKSATFAAPASDAVFATRAGDTLRLVRHDGVAVEIDPFDGTGASTDGRVVHVASGGGLVVVVARWAEGAAAASKATWWTRAGEPVASMDHPSDLAPVSVGPDGTSVLSSYSPSSPETTHIVRFPDGQTRTFTDFGPYGGHVERDWVRGWEPVGSAPGFYNLRTGEQRPLSALALDTYPQVHGEGYLYVSPGKSVPWLVAETLAGPTIQPLWAVGDAGGTEVTIWQARGGFALVGDVPTGMRWRTTIDTGESVRADGAPPPGREPLVDICGLQERSLASNGAIMAPVRDGGAARLSLFDPVTGSWSDVGLPVAAAGTFGVLEQAGTFVIPAGDASTSFCPITDWAGAPPAGSLATNTTQIVRPSSGALHVLDFVESWMLPLSPDGACAAVPDGETFRMLDVVTGEWTALAEVGSTFVWLD